MIVTRDTAIPVLRQIVVALVTGTVRGLPTEVPLGPGQGLARDCVVNCDTLVTIPKHALGRRRGRLGPEETVRLDGALRIALGL